MKKLISIILAVMLVSALAVTSLAAPTVDYTFNADGKAYVFGTVDSEITDMGIKITNKNDVREYAEFSALNASEIADVNTSGKFGFAIDPNGQLEETFTVKPYYKTADKTVEGASYALTPAEGTIKTVAEGSMLAAADAYIRGNDGKAGTTSTKGVLPTYITDPNTEGHQFMIQDERANYTGSGVARFDISQIDMDASDIVLKFGSRCGNSGMLKIVTEELKMTVRKVENATQDWEDTTEGFSGYSTITGGAKTNAKYTEEVYSNNDAIIATITDCEVAGTISGLNGATSSSGYVYFYADITEYVKAEKAKGNNSITIAIKGDALATTLYTYTRAYTTYPNQKVYLTWK